jgi:urea transport system substrate-binding protein
VLSTRQVGGAAGLSIPPGALLKTFPGSRAPGPPDHADELSGQRRDRKKLRVVNFLGFSGPAGIWGPAGVNGTLLAVAEINRRGGILGREIEMIFRDAGTCLDDVVRVASDIVAADDTDIIMARISAP